MVFRTIIIITIITMYKLPFSAMFITHIFNIFLGTTVCLIFLDAF